MIHHRHAHRLFASIGFNYYYKPYFVHRSYDIHTFSMLFVFVYIQIWPEYVYDCYIRIPQCSEVENLRASHLYELT